MNPDLSTTVKQQLVSNDGVMPDHSKQLTLTYKGNALHGTWHLNNDNIPNCFILSEVFPNFWSRNSK